MKKNINNYSYLKNFEISNLKFDFNTLLFNVDRDIKLYKSKLKFLKEELVLSKKLITLAHDELVKILDNNEKEKAVLTDDMNFFKDEIKKLNSDISKQQEILGDCLLTKKRIVDLNNSLKTYKSNVNNINELINQYNKCIETGTIYTNNNSLSEIELYKNNILSIIEKKKLLDNVIDSHMISVDILYNQLKDLEKIEKLYVNSNKNIELVEGHDNRASRVYISSDIDDFIFKMDEQLENNKKDYNSKLVIKEEINDFVCNSYPSYIPARKKIKKVKKVSKWQKIKKCLSKNIQKVLACLLIGGTMIFVPQISASDGTLGNSKLSLHQSNNIISTIDEAIDSGEINTDDTTKQIAEDIHVDDNILSDIDIGDKVDVNSDIYINANDAIKKENAMTSYYSTDDERSISVIAYSNGDKSDYITVTKDNKDKIKELEKLKYDVVAYCVSNDSQNIEYEGWHNIEDIKVKRY